jgi:hypothetical protein
MSDSQVLGWIRERRQQGTASSGYAGSFAATTSVERATGWRLDETYICVFFRKALTAVNGRSVFLVADIPRWKATWAGATARVPEQSCGTRDLGMHTRSLHGNRDLWVDRMDGQSASGRCVSHRPPICPISSCHTWCCSRSSRTLFAMASVRAKKR